MSCIVAESFCAAGSAERAGMASCRDSAMDDPFDGAPPIPPPCALAAPEACPLCAAYPGSAKTRSEARAAIFDFMVSLGLSCWLGPRIEPSVLGPIPHRALAGGIYDFCRRPRRGLDPV